MQRLSITLSVLPKASLIFSVHFPKGLQVPFRHCPEILQELLVAFLRVFQQKRDNFLSLFLQAAYSYFI